MIYLFIFAFILDQLLGELNYKYNPIILLGKYINKIEFFFNGNYLKIKGILSIFFVILPFLLIIIYIYIIFKYNFFYFNIFGFILYLSIAWRSLIEHGLNIEMSIIEGNINMSKAALSMIVSRTVNNLNINQIYIATIESIFENGNDAIFAPLFFLFTGPLGVIFYRIINTLDAMWGYKNNRYIYFGWSVAKLDDLLNFIPAILTGVIYACCSFKYKYFKQSFLCSFKKFLKWKSKNAGYVMSAGAGSINIILGGISIYNNKYQYRPQLGINKIPNINDITKTCSLINYSMFFIILSFYFLNNI
ncbi:Cobalamin biosynthesis protein CobD [Candidatus Johnevansia muelleri]|uniref:Cobalamin biosynthesis protein CobD n=1 Tax=Candidatus Johnevansia muelleri TaxID=1495769 RepID=A0A078KEV2_9GAMM|nr:Cobalamin biosynthesis protein CobD [Candidatus Evansia muelleri]